MEKGAFYGPHGEGGLGVGKGWVSAHKLFFKFHFIREALLEVQRKINA